MNVWTFNPSKLIDGYDRLKTKQNMLVTDHKARAILQYKVRGLFIQKVASLFYLIVPVSTSQLACTENDRQNQGAN